MTLNPLDQGMNVLNPAQDEHLDEFAEDTVVDVEVSVRVRVHSIASCLVLVLLMNQPAVSLAPHGQNALVTITAGASDAGGATPDTTLARPDFVIGPSDVLAISVWKEPELSRSVPVRPDGRISIPLLGDLMASGLTASELQRVIKQQLRGYVSNPEVTVIVQDVKSQQVNIFGEVAKPGSYVLAKDMTVLDAIGAAGGLKDFAKLKKIYVLRAGKDGARSRIAFNYKEVIKGRNSDQNIQLQPRDTVVVP
jgi:polysaccharide export outer membrane protein